MNGYKSGLLVRKEQLLKTCNVKDWDGYDADPVEEEYLNIVIDMALDIQKFFLENGVELEQPDLFPYYNLEFGSFDEGYDFCMDYYPEDDGWGAYGDNCCRNCRNKDKIELKTFHTPKTRKILVLFARWCKMHHNIEWKIEIQKEPWIYKKKKR